MKRTRRALDARTCSVTITKAVDQGIKRNRFWEAYDRFAEEAAKGDFFWPGYLEEIRPPGRMTRLQKEDQGAAALPA
ncbi:MAG TPA: hypothetical protein VFO89_04240 [Thermoanaerobaculia bacterium]|nr:hypothetical protein [Thermoanaerobaculia bacterium]